MKAERKYRMLVKPAMFIVAMLLHGPAPLCAQPLNVTIDGQLLRLQPTLDAPPLAILNPEAASRIHMSGGMMAPKAKVAGTTLRGRTATIRSVVGGASVPKLRVASFGRTYMTGFDGGIGVDAVPANHIWWSGERGGLPSYRIKLQRIRGKWIARQPIAGQSFDIRFDFSRSGSITNRVGGQILLDADKALSSGRVSESPVAFSIVRPVERLDLNGIDFGGRRLEAVDSRVSAERATQLKQMAATIDDEDEQATIVVNGRRPSERRYREKPYLILGKDWLGSCSARFTRSTGMLELFC